MSTYKVIVTDVIADDHTIEKDVLRTVDAEVFIHHCVTTDDVINACREADGILVSLAPLSTEVIKSLTRCKVISRYGVGYDNVDVAACTRQGIHVANVLNYCQEEVSDHALALLMSCSRRILQRDRLVRSGQWRVHAGSIFRMAGKTFSFLGFGSIARCLCRKIQGFNFARILVYDPFVDEALIQSAGGEKVSLGQAIREADYMSVHMPLTNQTYGIIDEHAFSMMKKNAIIINTSRGPIINQSALIEALQTGRIGGAGLDVFESEPINLDHPLCSLANCVLTDHISWYSEESLVELKRKAAENVRNVLRGEKPLYPLNFTD